MNVELIDIGANLTHDSFAADLSGVIAEAAAAGVTRQVVTGADIGSSTAAAALAARHPAVLWSTAGVHPHRAASFDLPCRDALDALLRQPRVVAVGECGLDYFRDLSPRAVQRSAFIAQLEMAVDAGKPVFLHQRAAHADFVAILSDFSARLAGGVAHCFTGSPAQLDEYLALGLHIGITGWVCDERRGLDLRAAVPLIPADRLMVETDAPYLLPRDLAAVPKSRRNEPKYLAHVARAVAGLRQESFESLAAATTRNAVEFFRLVEEAPIDS